MEPPADLQDWELLSETEHVSNPDKPVEAPAAAAADDDSEDGAIKPDYFALDPVKPRPPASDEDVDSGSVDSDNPSWLDPDSDSRYQLQRGQLDLSMKNARSFWSDESSETPRSAAAGEGEEAGLGFGEEEDEGIGGETKEGGSLEGGEGKGESSEGNGKERAWWRVPLEIVKLWVVRARPAWSISIAAAIVGVVLLGRRLYKMKHKGRSIPLRIAIDDKRASQFMARVARLNEAFSVVKRVPVVRPSLPAGGVPTWPMASLR